MHSSRLPLPPEVAARARFASRRCSFVDAGAVTGSPVCPEGLVGASGGVARVGAICVASKWPKPAPNTVSGIASPLTAEQREGA